MPRLVKHTAHGPSVVKTPKGDEVHVCRCGLTKNPQGLCDGSHTKTLDEKEGEVCCYDESGERKYLQKENKSEHHCYCNHHE